MPKKKTDCKIIRHSSGRFLKGFFKIPLKKFKTGGAKVGLFGIRILDPDRGVHDTPPIPAMGNAEGVTQFVHDRLFHPCQQEVRIGRLVIKPGVEPMQGYDRTLAFNLGQSKDELKDRHIQIHGRNADKSKGAVEVSLKETL